MGGGGGFNTLAVQVRETGIKSGTEETSGAVRRWTGSRSTNSHMKIDGGLRSNRYSEDRKQAVKQLSPSLAVDLRLSE